MKGSVFFSILIFSGWVLASETPKSEGFAERKAQALEMVDQRISGLQQLKACMSGAADQAALKDCRQKHHQSMMGMRMEMEDMRHEHKMKKLKDREARD